MKCRKWYGDICEQVFYTVPGGVRNVRDYDPEKQTKGMSREEKDRHNENIARLRHYRNFMANFKPGDLYVTLTFNDECEVHTAKEADKERDRLRRRLQRKYPDAVFFIYKGRGRTTARWHLHMVSHGIPLEFIREKWDRGNVEAPRYLRKKNRDKDGNDIGADYKGLANYLFDHWKKEMGGKRWFQTRNAKKPQQEAPKEVKLKGGYSAKRPPRAPKGYRLIRVETTTYGYIRFLYIREEKRAGAALASPCR